MDCTQLLAKKQTNKKGVESLISIRVIYVLFKQVHNYTVNVIYVYIDLSYKNIRDLYFKDVYCHYHDKLFICGYRYTTVES